MIRRPMTFLAPLVLLCACGGGGGGDDPGGGNDGGGLDEVSACTADSVAVLAFLTEAFDNLIAEINGNDRAEVTVWSPSTGAYVLDADLNDDNFDETTVSGQVTTVAGNYMDGLDVGDRIAAPWTLVSGPVDGNGSFGYEELAGNQRRLTGSGSVELLDGCATSFSNVNLTFSTVISGAPTGTLDFSLSLDGDTMVGTVTMNGTSIANVSASFKGAPVTFQIDTDDFTVVP